MDLADILSADAIIPSLDVTCKKQALSELAVKAAELTHIEQRDIFDGSTGLGRGIAIPHVKFKALTNIVCMFARLAKPIPFDSQDDQDVDLIFVLLAPEHASGDHLKALARISRLVREPATLEQLRSAKDADTLRRLLTSTAASHAA
jgi:PTS system nitrogen regulatory IIA component